MPIAAMDQAVNTYSSVPLMPALDTMSARTMNVNLSPNTVFARGTVLGQITAAQNDVQTLTLAGTTATSGSTLVTAKHPVSGATVTFSPVWNSSAAAAQVLVTAAFGSASLCTVTGGALPGTPLVFTFGGLAANMPIPLMTASATGLSAGATAAITHTTIGATAGTFKAYASGNSDGSQVPKGILKWDVATDGSGAVTLGTVAGGGPWGETTPTTDMYISGVFDPALLTGLDANAVTVLGGHFISGGVSSTTGGLFALPD